MRHEVSEKQKLCENILTDPILQQLYWEWGQVVQISPCRYLLKDGEAIRIYDDITTNKIDRIKQDINDRTEKIKQQYD